MYLSFQLFEGSSVSATGIVQFQHQHICQFTSVPFLRSRHLEDGGVYQPVYVGGSQLRDVWPCCVSHTDTQSTQTCWYSMHSCTIGLPVMCWRLRGPTWVESL